MEKKEDIKINIVTFFLIISIVVITVMGIFLYKTYNDKKVEDKKLVEQQAQVDNLSKIVGNLQNNISESNSTPRTSNTVSENNANKNEVKYEITVKDEAKAIIEATKNGKTISKEIKMEAMIDKTGIMDIPNIGTVALISDSGGEYIGVHLYQLINDEIKLLGDINCGADMIKEASYTVETKDEGIALINADVNGENISKEIEMSAAIANTSIIDILDYGKVVLIAESRGEYYEIQVYRLSQDYITGKNKEIINVGSIKTNI